jgi:hypothetical protein
MRNERKSGRKPRNGRPAGRPRKKTDERQVYELAKLGCTQNEAAAVLGIDHRTFKRRLKETLFYEAWEKGQAVGAVALHQLQWKTREEARRLSRRYDDSYVEASARRARQVTASQPDCATGG